jgi:hypothetical protein
MFKYSDMMPKRHTNWLVTFRNSKNITKFFIFSFQKCCPWRESFQLINSDSNFKGPKKSLPKFITVGGAKQGKIPPINKGHRAGKGFPSPLPPPPYTLGDPERNVYKIGDVCAAFTSTKQLQSPLFANPFGKSFF